jgi:hypothetical protein
MFMTSPDEVTSAVPVVRVPVKLAPATLSVETLQLTAAAPDRVALLEPQLKISF